MSVNLKSRFCCRYQREEAKIKAWVNLQDAKAEAQSRKLEVCICMLIRMFCRENRIKVRIVLSYGGLVTYLWSHAPTLTSLCYVKKQKVFEFLK